MKTHKKFIFMGRSNGLDPTSTAATEFEYFLPSSFNSDNLDCCSTCYFLSNCLTVRAKHWRVWWLLDMILVIPIEEFGIDINHG